MLPPKPVVVPDSQETLAKVYHYHDGTKHHFQRFARSLGYLDWASQPRPFRGFADARSSRCTRRPARRPMGTRRDARRLIRRCELETAGEPISAAAIGDVLRHALGLSAWKVFKTSRWALRVNPSSGNLHPTEAYVVCGAVAGLAGRPAVYHYAPDRHALELRCAFDDEGWRSAVGNETTWCWWRSRRFIGAKRGNTASGRSATASTTSATPSRPCPSPPASLGWRAALLPAWSQRAIAAATGIGRDEDFVEAEREEPACVMALTAAAPLECSRDTAERLAAAISRGQWSGRASQLSEDHVEWSFIEEIARATQDDGRRHGSGPRGPGHEVREVRGALARSMRARCSCSAGARSRSTGVR